MGGIRCDSNQDFDHTDPFGLNCHPLLDITDNGDDNVLESTILEPIEMAGAVANVHKILGVHEQDRLVDLLGIGRFLSSSNNDKENNPFDLSCSSWHSDERGQDVVTNAYIGYDFGPIKQFSGVLAYSVETRVEYEIGVIRIKQSKHANRRATRIRVERSDNGNQWKGVQVIDLPDTDEDTYIDVRKSAPARYWRLRPIKFNGVEDNMPWEIEILALYEFHKTSLDNFMQDNMGLIEMRDREYSLEPIKIKMYYDLFDARSELSRWGIDMGMNTIFAQVGFKSSVAKLGRPFVIGDIIEMPSEMQYNTKLQGVKKYVEVTDVSWSTEGYMPNWRPVIQRLILKPVVASQETMDLFDDIKYDPNEFGFIDSETNSEMKHINMRDVYDTTKSYAHKNLPEKGFQVKEYHDFSDEGMINNNLNVKGKGAYYEDAMPPNGEDYTEGDNYPDNPKNGAYHRLTYTELNSAIPARLYRYSDAKKQWIYCATDRRSEANYKKPAIARIKRKK